MLALIVDNSPTARTTLAHILTSLDFDTMQADNGHTALVTLKALPVPPDVVLVDWNTPQINGLELISAIRAQPDWQRTARIMMINNGEREHGVRAFAAGAHEYVVKPFTPDDIRERLRLLGLVAGTCDGGCGGSACRGNRQQSGRWLAGRRRRDLVRAAGLESCASPSTVAYDLVGESQCPSGNRSWSVMAGQAAAHDDDH